MKKNFPIKLSTVLAACLLVACSLGPQVHDGNTIVTNASLRGNKVTVTFTRGSDFANTTRFLFADVILFPQIAVWAQDTQGRYLQTLYVTHKFAKQQWGMPGRNKDSCFRRIALPYWLNKYAHAGNQAPTENKPMPDAITSATPKGSFDLNSTLNPTASPVVICAEIDRSFDYNQAYGDNRQASKINGQPAVVYMARMAGNVFGPREMTLAGHSGETGTDSLLYPDTKDITTAKNIFSSITVQITAPGDSVEKARSGL